MERVDMLKESERGNQRERDRERAQARAGQKPKNPKDDGLTPEQRRERDAKALQEKLARKAAQEGVIVFIYCLLGVNRAEPRHLNVQARLI
ncbi:conserved hypothetical protein [Ricinus communis]|uniref:Small EDRK-rich factor-like N-terminal domain-containing protein n=1 Tax=Ricinus communis TaxID=3988 RepID=B9S514_RICCO|nr:conserved hypothetical protein [Ricinus communis]